MGILLTLRFWINGTNLINVSFSIWNKYNTGVQAVSLGKISFVSLLKFLNIKFQTLPFKT